MAVVLEVDAQGFTESPHNVHDHDYNENEQSTFSTAVTLVPHASASTQ